MSKHDERARALCNQWRVEQRHLSPVWHNEVTALIAAVERETEQRCAAERAGLVAALRHIANPSTDTLGKEDIARDALRAAGERVDD